MTKSDRWDNDLHEIGEVGDDRADLEESTDARISRVLLMDSLEGPFERNGTGLYGRQINHHAHAEERLKSKRLILLTLRVPLARVSP